MSALALAASNFQFLGFGLVPTFPTSVLDLGLMIIFFVQIGVFKYELTPVALCLATKASSSWPRCTSVEARTPAVDHHGSSPTFHHSPDLNGQVHKSVNVGPAPKRTFDRFSINSFE